MAPTPVPPDQIKGFSPSIGIEEGRGASRRREAGRRRRRLWRRGRNQAVTIAGINFGEHEYDAREDTLHLRTVGSPGKPARTIATPEGHAIEYDDSGVVIGMMLVHVRSLLERDDAVTVTLPPDHVVAAQIKHALIAA
ncbi:MAG TPA: DUF2283 domain-containing protein [Solirubrobacteraceae bacterium]|nr:DUF2283 domain-containing protein [Solirubrobacteraceae bacterium]